MRTGGAPSALTSGGEATTAGCAQSTVSSWWARPAGLPLGPGGPGNPMPGWPTVPFSPGRPGLPGVPGKPRSPAVSETKSGVRKRENVPVAPPAGRDSERTLGALEAGGPRESFRPRGAR